MVIEKEFLDIVSAQAKASLRLHMNYDLRNSPEDKSQRMLNAIESGTVMSIHRHHASSETVICIRGHFEEYLYDENGELIETIDMRPGGAIVNVPAGQWHNLKSLESGTVLLEAKDGPYEPLGRMRFSIRYKKEPHPIDVAPFKARNTVSLPFTDSRITLCAAGSYRPAR